MTRALFLSLTFVPLLLACKTTSNVANSAHRAAPLAMIEGQIVRDFRCLFRPAEAIESLERRHLCSVEPGGSISRRREILVGDGLALNEVIRAVYGRAYDGQVRVFACDSITQTSINQYNPDQQKAIVVHPGDLVSILGRQ